MRLRLLLALASILVLAVLPPFVAPVAAADTTIVVDDGLTPRDVTVTPGDRITFRNDDGDRHRFRTDDGAPERFDVDLEPGESATIVLTTEGTYSYRDDRNRDDAALAGTITVSSITATTTPPGEGDPPPPTRVEVRMLDRSFSPSSISVAAGSTVVWRNVSDRDHTATADDRSFASPILGGGATFDQRFDQPGSYPYFCEIHPDMRGVVTVGEAGKEPPPAPPPPPPADTPPPPPPPPPAAPPDPDADPVSRTVQIVDFAFRPDSLQLRVGDAIVFANDGRAPHTATARDGTFDTGIIDAGARATVRLTTSGSFATFCSIHPDMTATLVVTDAADAAPEGPDASGGDDTGPDEAPEVPASEQAPPTGQVVAVVDFAFEPSPLEVTTRTEVTWRLDGIAPHTVTSLDGAFDSGIVQPGGTFQHRFDDPGTYRYVCDLHPQMVASVRVRDPDAPPTAPFALPERSDAGDSGSNMAAGLVGAAAILVATGALVFGASRIAGE